MYEKICTFFGDADTFSPDLTDKINAALVCLIENGYNTFYSGHFNSFDKMCEKTVADLKSKYPHIRLYGIVPELKPNESSYFDEIIEPYLKSSLHTQERAKCNYIIEKSDFVLCHVEKYFGFSWVMKKHAEKIGREVINLAEQYF